MPENIKQLLKEMNGVKYGNILDYVFLHRKDGTICERQFAKFLKNLGVEPIEMPGKIIELPYEHPGFASGLYTCPNTVIRWNPGDTKKFRICSPGWRYDGEQIIPIEIYPAED